MNKLLISSIITIALGLSACGTTPLQNADGESVQDIQSKLLGEMPMPGGARINNENSLILGSGDGWAGRVAFRRDQRSRAPLAGNNTHYFNVFRNSMRSTRRTSPTVPGASSPSTNGP